MASLSPRNYSTVELKGLCICGRLKAKLHCTACGSADTRGFAHKVRIRLKDGTRMTLRKYRCRRCGQAFTDYERNNCQAPQLYSRSEPLAIEESPQMPIEELFEQAQATDRLETLRKQSR